MRNPDKFFYDMVTRISEQSRCISRQVGAIITIDKRIVAEGWNSPPTGSLVEDCLRCKCKDIKSGQNLELAICTHAEANAIANAAYIGAALRNSHAVIYCTTFPCPECAKLIVASGIKEVVYHQEYNSPYTEKFFKNADVSYRKFNLDIIPTRQSNPK